VLQVLDFWFFFLAVLFFSRCFVKLMILAFPFGTLALFQLLCSSLLMLFCSLLCLEPPPYFLLAFIPLFGKFSLPFFFFSYDLRVFLSPPTLHGQRLLLCSLEPPLGPFLWSLLVLFQARTAFVDVFPQLLEHIFVGQE